MSALRRAYTRQTSLTVADRTASSCLDSLANTQATYCLRSAIVQVQPPDHSPCMLRLTRRQDVWRSASASWSFDMIDQFLVICFQTHGRQERPDAWLTGKFGSHFRKVSRYRGEVRGQDVAALEVTTSYCYCLPCYRCIRAVFDVQKASSACSLAQPDMQPGTCIRILITSPENHYCTNRKMQSQLCTQHLREKSAMSTGKNAEPHHVASCCTIVRAEIKKLAGVRHCERRQRDCQSTGRISRANSLRLALPISRVAQPLTLCT